MPLWRGLTVPVFFELHHQAPAVRRLDNSIHWINRYQQISFNKTNPAIRWIVIYSVDSVIHLLNNLGQVYLECLHFAESRKNPILGCNMVRGMWTCSGMKS